MVSNRRRWRTVTATADSARAAGLTSAAKLQTTGQRLDPRSPALVTVLLAVVFSRMSALLARGIGVGRVQVFGGAVSPAGDHPRTKTDQGDESPDCHGHDHEEE